MVEDFELRQLRQRALELALQYVMSYGGDVIALAKSYENYLLGVTEPEVPQVIGNTSENILKSAQAN